MRDNVMIRDADANATQHVEQRAAVRRRYGHFRETLFGDYRVGNEIANRIAPTTLENKPL